ncbi:MAG: SPFH domain-containing protein, partial [Clostridiales bacterium]|nr:SPFH domain-containing protein [Clostridiales bacterium]
MNEALTRKWTETRGLAIVSIAMNPVTLPEEDAETIKQAQRAAMMRDPSMAAATLVGAQADAMKMAAQNENGAMMGFMGMGMANQVGGMNAQGLFQMAQQQAQQAQQAPQAPVNGWTCSCGAVNTGKFCTNCASPKPAPAGTWTCSCGTANLSKFCQECGKPRPAGAPVYQCDKCGWKPEDPEHPPRFCPECGDRFDENDIK